MIIDAHQHCWLLKRPECAWPTPDLVPIFRDFGPEDWQAEANRQGVHGSILVQSQADRRDTDYLMGLASQHHWILGVVGWVDLKAPDAPERIRELARSSKLCGLRPMLQAIEDDSWIDDPALDPAVEAMIDSDLCFDALVYARHLPYLERFARRHPSLTVVVDHAAKPPIASGDRSEWPAQMARLASLPNIYCKLSGLLTEAKVGSSPSADQSLDRSVLEEDALENSFEQLRPWVSDLLAWFGPGRLLWGSDWPLVNLVSDYASWVELTEQLLVSLSEHERTAIWGENARRIYGLEDTRVHGTEAADVSGKD